MPKNYERMKTDKWKWLAVGIIALQAIALTASYCTQRMAEEQPLYSFEAPRRWQSVLWNATDNYQVMGVRSDSVAGRAIYFGDAHPEFGVDAISWQLRLDGPVMPRWTFVAGDGDYTVTWRITPWWIEDTDGQIFLRRDELGNCSVGVAPVPDNSQAIGIPGQITVDGNFLYVNTTNGWKVVQLQDWVQ